MSQKNLTKLWVVVSGIILILHVNRYLEIVTHEWMLVGDLLLATLLVSSFLLLFISRKISSSAARRVLTAASVCICCVSSLRLLILIIGMAMGGYVGSFGEKGDASFELIDVFTAQHSNIKTYRTNCGATCSFGSVVRQEMPLFLGLNLTKYLGGHWKCEVSVKLLDSNKIEIFGCEDAKTIQLKSFVYL